MFKHKTTKINIERCGVTVFQNHVSNRVNLYDKRTLFKVGSVTVLSDLSSN